MSVQATDPVTEAFGRLSLTGWRLAAIHMLFIGAVLSPMLWAEYPPLVDYPNHLARIHVLANLDRNTDLQRYYSANWTLLPNVAMDALLVPLARIVPIYLLGKSFVVTVLLLFLAGTYALRWVLWRRIGLWPLAVLLVVYNYVLAWGFLNYLFGVGLAMLSLAGWIWARDNWSWRWLVPASALAALILFFSHLFALGVYALSIAGFELGRSLHRRREPLRYHIRTWTLAGLQFVLPIALALQSSTVSDSGLTFFDGLKSRIAVALSATTFHDHAVDAGILGFLIVLLVGGCVLRRFTLHTEMKVPLLLLLVAAIAMPAWLLGSWGAHFRILPVLAAIAVAASDLRLRRDLFSFILPVLGCALLIMRIGDMSSIVQRNDAMMNELRTSLKRTVPEGASLMVAIDLGAPEARLFDRSWFSVLHLGSYAVIDRSVFLPTLFTDPRKQPLVVKPAYRMIDTPFAPPVSILDMQQGTDRRWADQMYGRRDWRGMGYYWAHWPRHYDRVLVIETQEAVNPDPNRLQPLGSGSFFTVYRVKDAQPSFSHSNSSNQMALSGRGQSASDPDLHR